MFKVQQLEWRRLRQWRQFQPSLEKWSKEDEYPYDGRAVLLCFEDRIFEANFMTDKFSDFDNAYALAEGITGYWLGPYLIKEPYGIRRHNSRLPDHPVYWAPAPDLNLREENLVEAMRVLKTETHPRRAIIIQAPEWVRAVDYQPEHDVWIDSFRRPTSNGPDLNGIVIEIPRTVFPEYAKIEGYQNPIWR